MHQLVTPKKNVVQPRLEIGRPDDKYEKEADAMADRVMRMPSSENLQMKSAGPGPDIQMKCTQCEEEEKIQMKVMGNTGNMLRMKQTGGEKRVMASEEVSRQLMNPSGFGSPLPKSVQQEMGNKIGTDFSRVKVHTDNTAVQLSEDLGAKAFTVGNNIYFNKGQYNPNSGDGKRLMAHELVHTVQQIGNESLPDIQREVSVVDHIKIKLGLGPSEVELLEIISDNASKASDLLDKTDKTLEVAKTLFQDNAKVRQKIQIASKGLKKISSPVKKLKKGTQIAQKALTVLEFVDAVEELDKIDVAKNPDKAAKAFDKVFRSAGEVYSLLPKGIQNMAPQLKLLQSWGSFFENMTYGLHPSKRGGNWESLNCTGEEIRDGKCSYYNPDY